MKKYINEKGNPEYYASFVSIFKDICIICKAYNSTYEIAYKKV